MRLALGIEYDGSIFWGWQTQPSGMTVQDRLESALKVFTGKPHLTVCAGRTDRGVHALCQVVHIDTDIQRENISWVRGTNSYLDPRIRVLWAQPVSDDFHARYSALSRTYSYLLLNDTVDAGLMKFRTGWFHLHLDEVCMRETASCLLGEHDFSAFRAAECQAKTPIRTIKKITIDRAGKNVIFTFVANAFLHHMVRNMVGSLIYVGSGRQPMSWLRTVLESRDRKLAAPTIAPDGLYLTEVEYAPDHNLPSPPHRTSLFDLQR